MPHSCKEARRLPEKHHPCLDESYDSRQGYLSQKGSKEACLVLR